MQFYLQTTQITLALFLPFFKMHKTHTDMATSEQIITESDEI